MVSITKSDYVKSRSRKTMQSVYRYLYLFHAFFVTIVTCLLYRLCSQREVIQWRNIFYKGNDAVYMY